MIKVSSVQCPHCGHPLDIKPDIYYYYCPYCGAKLILEDDSKKVTRKEININKTYKKINEAEVIKAQNELEKIKIQVEESKRQDKVALIGGGASFVGLVLLSLFALIMSRCGG